MKSKFTKAILMFFISSVVVYAQNLKSEGVAVSYLNFNEDKKQTVIKSTKQY